MSSAETGQTAESTAAVGVDGTVGGEAADEPQIEVSLNDRAADDPLLMCLVFLTKFHGRPRSADVLRAGLPYSGSKMTPSLFLRAAERVGLTGRVTKRRLTAIPDLVLPAIVMLKNDQAWVIIERRSNGNFVMMVPEAGGGTHQIEPKMLAERYTGYAIFIRPEFRFGAQKADADMPRPRSWFWGTLARSWWIYLQVALAAILINIFALASPLFVMNVYDRVLPNNAVETGWVLAIGVATVFLFDFLIRTLRAVFVDFAGKRADVILACRIFDQVLDMRMEDRPNSAGAFASMLREFETLRDFFTSATLVAFIDLPFVFLFILVIWFIGGPIALVLLISVTLVLGVGLIIQLPLRYVVKKNLKEGENKHGILVESLSGLETIKSIGAESRMRLLWEGFVSLSAMSAQQTRFFSGIATSFAFFVQQMTTVAVVMFGIYLVGEGELTVGGLIACVILSGRTLGPLGAAAQLMTRYHSAMSALRSLNVMMELPTERPMDKAFLHRPQLNGDIVFDAVNFSYPNEDIEVLKAVSFSIKSGERVGFVGRVGSGKSTVAKLLIGLYPPGGGTITIDGTEANSTGRRNTFSLTGLQALVQSFGGSSPSEGLAGPCIERVSNNCEYVRTVCAQIGSFREVLSKQSIGVLVRSALPRAVRFAEVDGKAGCDPQIRMLGHLCSLVPGQRAAKLRWQCRDRPGDGIANRFSPMTGKRRPVLHARDGAVAFHSGKMQQHCEPRGAFHQSADRRSAQADDQVTFPVSGYGPISCFRRSFTDHDLRRDEGFAPPAATCPRHAQCPSRAKAGGQLTTECAAALYVERLIDRLMTDPHRLILGPVPRIVDPKTVRDLLRTPGPGPSPVLPRPMPTTVPDDAWPLDHRSIRCRDPTRKPILHIAPQRLIRCQLGWLRPFGGSISMPLRRRCSVVQATASGRRVAPHLAGDRRRCSLQPASNMTYASSLGAQKSNLLTFLERQVTS